MKKFTRVIAAVVALVLLVSATGMTAFAASYEDYKTVYTDQVAYYRDVYKPVYREYHRAINDLRSFLRDCKKMSTKEDYEKVAAELKQIVADHHAFYGDRVTEGTSRYDVPRARAEMYASKRAKNYDKAITDCQYLKYLVSLRVDFMKAAIARMEAIKAGVEETPDYAVTLRVTPKNAQVFNFEIVVTNKTAAPVANWAVDFTYDGFFFATSTAFKNSGATCTAQTGGHIVLTGTTAIPAGASLVIPAKSGKVSVANGFADAKILTATVNGAEAAVNATVVAG